MFEANYVINTYELISKWFKKVNFIELFNKLCFQNGDVIDQSSGIVSGLYCSFYS